MSEPIRQAPPIGPPVTGWSPRPRPERRTFEGRYVTLVPLEEAHASALFAAYATDPDGDMWAYMPVGPFGSEADFTAWIRTAAASQDPVHYTLMVGGTPMGTASLMRIDPANGAIEVGNITYSPALQRTCAATEAMALLMQWVFEAGYRRYEWKCNALNAPSRRAAERYGFRYEGTFRQHMIVKGRNRDTAWFAMTDTDWPRHRDAFNRWLSPTNFDAEGRQRQSLAALTDPAQADE